MKNIIKIFLVCFLIVSCDAKKDDANLTIETTNGEIKYNLQEAVTHDELAKGLMDIETMDENTGMIFDLSNVEGAAMWMKDTKLPLDMIFADETGEIVWIYENAQPMSEDLIISPVEFSYVVEVNAGEVAKNQIQVGNKMKHKFFNNN